VGGIYNKDYEFGLFYGGTHLEAGHRKLMDWFQNSSENPKLHIDFQKILAGNVRWSDIHTGLGNKGDNVILGAYEDTDDLIKRFYNKRQGSDDNDASGAWLESVKQGPKRRAIGRFNGVQCSGPGKSATEYVIKEARMGLEIEHDNEYLEYLKVKESILTINKMLGHKPNQYDNAIGFFSRPEWLNHFFKPEGRVLVVVQEHGTHGVIDLFHAMAVETLAWREYLDHNIESTKKFSDTEHPWGPSEKRAFYLHGDNEWKSSTLIAGMQATDWLIGEWQDPDYVYRGPYYGGPYKLP